MWLFRSKRKPKIFVDQRFASSVVLLGYPGYSRPRMTEKLLEMIDKGYHIGHTIRPTINGPCSETLGEFIGGLEAAGYLERAGSGLVLTENGADLLEERILRFYRIDPDSIRAFSRDFHFDIDSVIDRFLDRHLKD